MPLPEQLRSDQLHRRCDPSGFSFETTADLPPLGEYHAVIHQPEAVKNKMTPTWISSVFTHDLRATLGGWHAVLPISLS